ncbi:MAG: hypothetical protein OXG80_02090 [Chloroflexi bacterium]|nr:hypothetical protein [Chloroflexota bacterium]
MSEAKWKLMVDWGGEGEFADNDDDITAATLGLSLRHLRDLGSEYIDAARLDIRLANADHKYSPPNGKSELSGNLEPGRKVWLRAAFPCDMFAGVADTILDNHAPDYGESYAWSSPSSDFCIADGGGAKTNGARNGKRISTMDFALADASLGCDFTRGSNATQHGGLTLRYSDADNFLYIRVNGSAVQLRKVEDGTDSLLAQAALEWNAADTHFIHAELHGDSIRVFVGREQLIAASSYFNVGATRHGLYCDGAADHTWQQFGGWASLFYGDLHSIEPQPNAKQCHIRAYDEMRRLENVTLYMYATSSFPQTSDEILGDILDYAGAESAARMLDTGTVLVPQLWSPALWDEQASDEIRRLQDEEDGFVYVDGRGFWRLESRTHRASASHTKVRATLQATSDSDDSAGAYFSSLRWSDGVGNIENKLFMRIRDATNDGHRTAWTLGEKPYFSAGETREFLAESKDYDVVGGQLTPKKNTDYTANTQADDGGADITDELTVTYPATRLYNGKGTLIRVRFGSTAGYLTRLGMRTVNALAFNAPVLVSAKNRSSQASYGQRIRSIDARWTREAHRAQTTLNLRLARRSKPRAAITVALPNGSALNTLLALQLRLSDRITLQYEAMGVDGEFYIEGSTLDVAQAGKRMERTLLLRQA